MKRSIYMIVPEGCDGYGGMSRFAKYFTEEWRRRHPGSRIVVLDSYGPWTKWGMPFFFVAGLASYVFAVVRGAVSVCYVNMAERGSLYRKLAFVEVSTLCGVPTVVHLHAAEFASFFRGSSRLTQALARRVFKRSTRIVVLGAVWQDLLTEEIGVPISKVRIVWNGVPETPLAKPEFAAPPALLFLGALTERKGTSLLIRAISRLATDALEFRCTIAGNGNAASYRDLADHLGIADRVSFPGWIAAQHAGAALATATVFVLPSRNEGLPLAILEAMAAGLPIVSTPVGAIPEAVEHGVNGLLVPPDDVDALAGALRQLIDNPQQAKEMGRRGSLRHRTHFSVSAMVDKLEAVLDEAGASQQQRD